MKITRKRLMEIAGLTEAVDPNSTYRIDTDFEGYGIASQDIQKVSGDPVTAAMAVKSSEVRTCFTVAPVECDTAADPASALSIVKVSPDGPAVIKTISSLIVSGSIATVN